VTATSRCSDRTRLRAECPRQPSWLPKIGGVQAPDLLVSDADLARVISELGSHYGTGRLTVEEFQQRLDEANDQRGPRSSGDMLNHNDARSGIVPPLERRPRGR
jgi:Domain of unknown function (DUF1707)